MPVFCASRCTSRSGSCVASAARPDSTSATRAEGSGTIWKMTCLMLGLPPQYLSKASITMREPRWCSTMRYGPAPIGLALKPSGPTCVM